MSESPSSPEISGSSGGGVSDAEKAALVSQTSHEPITPENTPTRKPARGRVALIAIGLMLLIAAGIWYLLTRGQVSTDDAYVNGHVTLVAPRVAGQAMAVYVDDNDRVKKGDLLLQLDPEPYDVAVKVAQAEVNSAQADLTAAIDDTRAAEGKTRSLRFGLERAIEDVDNQVALLRSKVAVLQSQQALRDKAKSDFDRVAPLVASGAVTREEYEHRNQDLLVAQANYEEALQSVYSARVALGLAPQPPGDGDLANVPADLDQTFSGVRQAQASLMQSAAELGVTASFQKTPKELVADFYKRDPGGDIDKIYDQILKDAPAVKQAQAKLMKAQADLQSAQLNRRYCDVHAEINGVITRRDVNPGDNLAAGQSVMAIRSLTQIWIDANFKETQLADLRIGQPADLDVDMYGSRRTFKGRIEGFEMGTGSTLALLPAENATGNFVKVVQRLPVRIEVLDYDADKIPLFTGTSVNVTVYKSEPPTGPDAGKVLRAVISPGEISSPATTQANTQPAPETQP